MKTDPALIEYMETFLTAPRRDLFRRVLAQRTNHFTVMTEDVYQLHNTSAVLRSCDGFGVQNLHVVQEVNAKKIDTEIAMGAQKWVDVNRHSTTNECLDNLRENNYRIIATSPHKGTLLQNFDISQPAAICFGTEISGLSGDVLEQADEFLQIPMVGFTESLNISVSAAIILQELTSRMRRSEISWQLPEEEILAKRLDWAKKTIKSADEIIERFQASY